MSKQAMKKAAIGLGTLALVFAFCAFGANGLIFGIRYWKNQPESPTMEAAVRRRLPVIRRLGDAAALRCGEVLGRGLMAQIAGPASPAHASPLARDPAVTQVRITCMEPLEGGTSGGSSWPALRSEAPEMPDGRRSTWVIDRGFFTRDVDERELEEVRWPPSAPSLYRVEVRRPMPQQDGWVAVVVDLRAE